MSTSRGIVSFSIALAAVLAAGQVSQAQIHVTRHSGGGTTTFAGDDTVAGAGVVAGGLYATSNFQDNGGPGAPDDFGANNDIPGDVIGVDENDWALYGHGLMHVNTTGSYRFRSGTDDSSHITIDGRNVQIQTSCCGNADGANLIPLTAGQTYVLAWTVKEGGGGGGGEFSVDGPSTGAGVFELLSSVSGSGDFTIDQAYTGPRLYSRVPGLVREDHTGDGLATLNSVTDAFLAGNPVPDSTGSVFASTGALPVDTLVTASGLLEVFAGDDIDPSTPAIEVKFRLSADDNALLEIGGLRIIENDGGHGTPHFYTDNQDLPGAGDNAGGVGMYSFPSAGLYDIFYYVHNGGAGGSADVLSSIGTAGNAGMAVIPDARLFVPEPSSFALASVGMLMLISIFRKRRVA